MRIGANDNPVECDVVCTELIWFVRETSAETSEDFKDH